MPKLRELRDELNAVNKKLHELHESVEKEDRGLNSEESAEWNRLQERHTDVCERIQRAEFLESNKPSDELEQRQQELEDRQRFEDRRNGRDSDERNPRWTPEQRTRALTAWGARRSARPDDLEMARQMGLEGGTISLRFDRGFSEHGIAHRAPKTFKEIEQQAEARASWESRAQAVGTAAAGGNVVPDEMMRAIERALLQFGGMRQVATVINTATGADLPIPTTNDTSNVGEILGENTQVNEQDVTFGQIVLQAYKYSSKMVRVSMELMEDSAVNLPALLGSMLGERLGRILNTHFTTGTGTAQPNGIVTAAADSSVTTASNTAITYSELLDLKHSVDPAYRLGGRGGWMMADPILKLMKEMTDSQNRPLWLPSLIPGEPETFDGDRIYINQDMPTGSSAKAIIYGDFSKYMIRDTHEVEIMRLDERYADFHQVAFLGFGRWDGDLTDAGTNPVKYLTLAV